MSSKRGKFLAQPPALKSGTLTRTTAPPLVVDPSAQECTVFRAEPAVVHFGGFTVGDTLEACVRVVNVARKGLRMIIHPTSTKYFTAHVEPRGTIAPGMAESILVTFTPDAYRYFYDVIRVQSDEHTLLIPLHGYPVVQTFDFPRLIDFGYCELGRTATRVIPLRSSVPVDFTFTITVLKAHPSIRIEPYRGTIPGEGETSVRVSFTPSDATVTRAEVEVDCSQYNFTPVRCEIVGSSDPSSAPKDLHPQESLSSSQLLDLEQQRKLWRVQHSHGAGAVVDPGGETLRRARTRTFEKRKQRERELRESAKLAQRSHDLAAESDESSDGESVEVAQPEWGPERDVEGILVPHDTHSMHAVQFVLTQEPGKLKPRDIPRAVARRRKLQRSQQKFQRQMLEEQRSAELTATSGSALADARMPPSPPQGQRLSKHQKATRVSLSLPAMLAEERAGKWIAQALGAARGVRVDARGLWDWLCSLPDHATLEWEAEGRSIDLGEVAERWLRQGRESPQAADTRKLREMVFRANLTELQQSESAREFQAKGVWFGEPVPSQSAIEIVQDARQLWDAVESRLLGLVRRRRKFTLTRSPQQHPPHHAIVPSDWNPPRVATLTDPTDHDPWLARRRVLRGLRSLVDAFLVQDRARTRLRRLQLRLAEARRQARAACSDDRTAMEDLVEREARADPAAQAIDQAGGWVTEPVAGTDEPPDVTFALSDFRYIRREGMPHAPVLPDWDTSDIFDASLAMPGEGRVEELPPATMAGTVFPVGFPPPNVAPVEPPSLASIWNLDALPPYSAPTYLPRAHTRLPRREQRDGAALDNGPEPWVHPRRSAALWDGGVDAERVDQGVDQWGFAPNILSLKRTLPESAELLARRQSFPTMVSAWTSRVPKTLVPRVGLGVPRLWLLSRDARSRMLQCLEPVTEASPGEHLLQPCRTIPTIVYPHPHPMFPVVAVMLGHPPPRGSAVDVTKPTSVTFAGGVMEPSGGALEDRNPQGASVLPELDPNGNLLTRSQLFLGSYGWHSLRASQGDFVALDTDPEPVGAPLIDLVAGLCWGPFQFAVQYKSSERPSVHPRADLPDSVEVPERRGEGMEAEKEGLDRWAEARRAVVSADGTGGKGAGLGGKHLLPVPAAAQRTPLSWQFPPMSLSPWELPGLPPHLPGPLHDDMMSDDSESDVEEDGEDEATAEHEPGVDGEQSVTEDGSVPRHPGWARRPTVPGGQDASFPTVADAAVRFGRLRRAECIVTENGRQHWERLDEKAGAEAHEEEHQQDSAMLGELEADLAASLAAAREGREAEPVSSRSHESSEAAPKDKKGGKGKEKEKRKSATGGDAVPAASSPESPWLSAWDATMQQRGDVQRAWQQWKRVAVPAGEPVDPSWMDSSFEGTYGPSVPPAAEAALTRSAADDAVFRADVDSVAQVLEEGWNRWLLFPQDRVPLRFRVPAPELG